MERGAGQIGNGKQKASTGATGKAAVISTVPFTCPSTKVVIATTKPEFAEVAAVINAIMADYPSEVTTPHEQATISGKLLDYFGRYCVRLTREQFIEGGKVVAKAYKSAGLPKMPKGKALVVAIVFLAYCPTQEDRRAFLAHMSRLSGLVGYMSDEHKQATQRVLEG